MGDAGIESTTSAAVRLGRLAVRQELQRQDIGTRLLIHARKQTLTVAGLVGVSFVVSFHPA
jgi:predicted N-acetyltransferase YhbS